MDFTDFFEDASPGLLRLCYLATLDVEAAADAAQEALARAWRDWDRIARVGSDPGAWTRTVAGRDGVALFTTRTGLLLWVFDGVVVAADVG